MDTYSLLRELADSWVLLLMFGFFVAAILWAFRPGSGRVHRDSAGIPFRHDDKPAPVTDGDRLAPVSGGDRLAPATGDAAADAREWQK